MKKILKNKKGFTLVELIVVIAILGVLAVIMVPQFTKYINKANAASDLSEAKAYCTAYQAAYAEAEGKDMTAALAGLGYGEGYVAEWDHASVSTTSEGGCVATPTN